MPLAHASLLGPSSSKRIISCPGSVRMSKDIERDIGRAPSNYMADRGTCLHEAADRALKGELCLDTFAGRTMVMVAEGEGQDAFVGFATEVPAGTPIAFSIEVSADDVDAVRVYVEIIEQYRATAVDGTSEIRVDISDSVDVPDQFGTSDAILVLPYIDMDTGEEGHELVVADLKTGRIAVSPDENSQAMLYALGALKLFADRYNILSVRVVIVQPMISRRPLEWVTTPAALYQWRDDVARPAGREVLRLMEAPITVVHDALRPTDSGCEWCYAKSRCPALAGVAVSEVFGAVDDFTATQPLAHIDIWRAFRLIPLIETWLDALKAEVERLATAGQHDGSVKVVRGRSGARKWTEGREEAVAAMLETLLGDAAFKPRALQSPTQIEKALKKSAPDLWAVLAEDVTTPLGRVQVVPVGDPREAIARDEGAAPEGSTADFL